MRNPTGKNNQLATFLNGPRTDQEFFENLTIKSISEEADLRGSDYLGIPARERCEDFCCPEFWEKLRPDGNFYGDYPTSNASIIICRQGDNCDISALPSDGFNIVSEENIAEAGILYIAERPNENYPGDIKTDILDNPSWFSTEDTESATTKQRGTTPMMITDTSVRLGFATHQLEETRNTKQTALKTSPLKGKITADKKDPLHFVTDKRRKLEAERQLNEEAKKIKERKEKKKTFYLRRKAKDQERINFLTACNKMAGAYQNKNIINS